MGMVSVKLTPLLRRVLPKSRRWQAGAPVRLLTQSGASGSKMRWGAFSPCTLLRLRCTRKHGTEVGMLKRLVQGSVVGLGSAGVILALWGTGLLDNLEHPTWTWRVELFAPRTRPDPQVKVVLLDQASLEWGNKENGWSWPWPRSVYGAILDFCRRGGAKAVAFDVL